MEISWNLIMRGVLESVIFSVIGLIFFAITFYLVGKLAPFSIQKEIEEDQNTALGIVIGSLIIGIAMIVSAAMHG